jgi:hypothetical protein
MRRYLIVPGLLLASACVPAAASHLVPGAGAGATPVASLQRAAVGIPAAASSAAAPSQYTGGWDSQRYLRARLIVDNDRDWFRQGDRLRLRFTTSEDAYVAIIHISPDGYLDFVFPSSPWENDYVRGGRSHSLARGYQAGLTVRGRPGIGYVYMIASPVPLDYRGFQRGRGGPWDWSLAGRNVVGDPFWAMEQITRQLVPHWNVPYAVDHFSYHVDGRHRYPYYACASNYRGMRGGWGWTSAYSSCDRLDLFLRQHPYYYDTRLYRGDRRAYLHRTYGTPQAPPHEFKESPRTGATGARGGTGAAGLRGDEQVRFRDPEPARTPVSATPRAQERPAAQQPPARERPQPQERTGSAQQPAPQEPRQRPTLERREPAQREQARPAPQPTQREQARPAPQPTQREPARPAPQPTQREQARPAPQPTERERPAPRQRDPEPRAPQADP